MAKIKRKLNTSKLKKGSFSAYLRNTNKIPKTRTTTYQKSMYILNHPKQFNSITRKRANLYVNVLHRKKR